VTEFELVLLALIAVILALLALLQLWSRATRYSIIPSPDAPFRHTFTNHSRAAVPIGRVGVFVAGESDLEPLGEPPAISGIDLPGTLAPKASFDISFSGARQIAEIVCGGEYVIVIYAPDGRVIKSQRARVADPGRGAGDGTCRYEENDK
jgi:hypothetical protein